MIYMTAVAVVASTSLWRCCGTSSTRTFQYALCPMNPIAVDGRVLRETLCRISEQKAKHSRSAVNSSCPRLYSISSGSRRSARSSRVVLRTA